MVKILSLLLCLLLLSCCADPAAQEQTLGPAGSPVVVPMPTFIEPTDSIPSISAPTNAPTPSEAPVATSTAIPSPTTAPTPTIDPMELEPVTLEVIEGRAPLGVEEVVTRFYYALDGEIEPCMTSMKDLALLTAIRLERVEHPAFDSHTIHFSFREGPDYIWENTIVVAPYAKVGYGELTGDGRPEIIVLLGIDYRNVEHVEPGYHPFVFTWEQDRYVLMELPQLDSTVTLNWGPFWSDNEDPRFPTEMNSEISYRVPEGWLLQQYDTQEKRDTLANGEMSGDEALEEMYERGMAKASIMPVNHFAVGRENGKNYLMFRQYVSFRSDMNRIGQWVCVIEFQGTAGKIVDKRLLLLPPG